MQIHFLGTAASEGIPNPYCSCHLCDQTRASGGKDVRTRSSVIIDEVMQIDISPEFSYQLMRDGTDARKITNLLFTHTHLDHFNISELYSRMAGFSHHITHPLNVYGNDIAISNCAQFLQGYSRERFHLQPVIPFVTIESQGYRITPLLANHAVWEFCYLYFIEKDGKSFFYGHDSGWYPDLTWEWLAQKKIDLIVLECTTGFNKNERSNNHMSIETILAVQENMMKIGCYDNDSQIILSHISHNIEMNHHELENLMRSHRISIAYDGLKITI
ncbi:MBL fold metallo-hydrolase [Erwinia sp. BNK-24-b]|uniref:MBL fold metallo-hydrolase n=1 Tax=unclassified Erwinia TaxID=2622719 RepID=UPI0039BF00F8